MRKKCLVSLAAAMVAAANLPVSPLSAAEEAKPAQQVISVDPARLSPELLAVAKLVQSGVDEKVIVTYLQQNPVHRAPTADELVYLRQLGLSSEAMVTLLNSAPKPASPQPLPGEAPAAAPTAPVQAAPATPAPVQAPVQVQPTAPPPVYVQPAPVYLPPPVVYQPYYTRPTFSIGIGLGHPGWGWHGHGHYGHGYYGRHH